MEADPDGPRPQPNGTCGAENDARAEVPPAPVAGAAATSPA